MADDNAIKAAGGCPGFMSPIGIDGAKAVVVVDATVANMKNAVTGANEVDFHYKNVTPSRDFPAFCQIADIRLVKEGDACPKCGAPLTLTRGIEAGQVFALGTKYSEKLNARFLDETGKEKPFQMGCYGIGVGRTMQAAIEQNGDENGIVWPRAIAPFEVAVVPINGKDEQQLSFAQKIYDELKTAGIDALLDDRPERAGVKFKDCDLIGYPLRITVSPKGIENGEVEVKVRKTGEIFVFAADAYLTEVQNLLREL